MNEGMMNPAMLGLEMAGGGMMAPGGSPMGGPPQAAMSALDQLSKSSPQRGPKEALDDATAKLQVALMRIYLMNPKAAKLVSDALSKVQQAQSELTREGSSPVGAPPNLLGQGAQMGGGMPMGLGL